MSCCHCYSCLFAQCIRSGGRSVSIFKLVIKGKDSLWRKACWCMRCKKASLFWGAEPYDPGSWAPLLPHLRPLPRTTGRSSMTSQCCTDLHHDHPAEAWAATVRHKAVFKKGRVTVTTPLPPHHTHTHPEPGSAFEWDLYVTQQLEVLLAVLAVELAWGCLRGKALPSWGACLNPWSSAVRWEWCYINKYSCSWVPVAYNCNPSYLGGWHRKDWSLSPGQANSLQDLISK
jgi:hypothetical protein